MVLLALLLMSGCGGAQSAGRDGSAEDTRGIPVSLDIVEYISSKPTPCTRGWIPSMEVGTACYRPESTMHVTSLKDLEATFHRGKISVPVVRLLLQHSDVPAFRSLSRRASGHYESAGGMAIVIDGRAVIAASLPEPLQDGNVEFQGSWTEAETARIVRLIRQGGRR